jgi:hypothetical protein
VELVCVALRRAQLLVVKNLAHGVKVYIFHHSVMPQERRRKAKTGKIFDAGFISGSVQFYFLCCGAITVLNCIAIAHLSRWVWRTERKPVVPSPAEHATNRA